ncbi:hypothetical protein [Streptomyces canus]|uniref:hypothetical protein n=1 Tax=Streptomyces canus TaxID=58343 RepID=UPI0038683E05|nr:hypothetical protein OH824_17760 [Streptomyces canus]
MPELRTVVHIATTHSRANEARELLKTLQRDLNFDRYYTGPVENWRAGGADDPRQLTMFLAGDVHSEVESRLSDMAPTFDVSVDVWEELNL